jgi:branched-chain amino acid transport system permease protein
VAETTLGFYLSTGYRDVPALALLLLVLALRPAGLSDRRGANAV